MGPDWEERQTVVTDRRLHSLLFYSDHTSCPTRGPTRGPTQTALISPTSDRWMLRCRIAGGWKKTADIFLIEFVAFWLAVFSGEATAVWPFLHDRNEISAVSYVKSRSAYKSGFAILRNK